MSRLFWYYGLAGIGVGIATFVIYRKRHIAEISTFIVFYLFATSITWLSEFVVLGLFNSYAYKPGVFTDPWADNILGHLILNSTLWPATAVLVAAYWLGYGWITLTTVAYLLIEFLFLRIGIYEQHWWKFYMTAIVIFLFQVISKTWFVIMNQKRHGLPRLITFFFVAFVIIHVPLPLLLIFGKQYYIVGLTENLYRSSAIFILFFHLVESFLLVFFVCILKKWYWKLAPFIIAFAIESTLAIMNILIFHDGWNLFYTLLVRSISLIVFILLEKYTLQTHSIKNGIMKTE